MQQLEVVFGSIPTIMNGAKANYDTSGRLFAASDQRGMLIRDKKNILPRRGARTYPERDNKVGVEPAARLGSMVRGRPTTFAAQMIEIGGLSWENSNFASIDLFFFS
jgi:hypothetical protein